MKTEEAFKIIGGSLSKPSKMPGWSIGLPAKECKTGGKLQKVPGSVCYDCYALKGCYVFKVVQDAQYRRLAAIKSPDWVQAMAHLINSKKPDVFRWHDSGDIQGVWHLEKIAEVARRLPHIKFWLPTREYRIVREWMEFGTKPDNLTIRLSAYMMNGKPPVVAKTLGLPTSGVSNDSFSCPAPSQGNECKDCRACWDNDVENINYKKH